MGDFHPLAHVKGSSGCSFIAFICNSCPAVWRANSLSNIIGQMYKVFIKDSSLTFYDHPVEEAQKLTEYAGKEQLMEVVLDLEKSEEIQHRCFLAPDLTQLWKDLTSYFTVIEAAGGVVKNASDEILMIYRLGKWDLPKGKLEEGESVKEGAKREVIEECGISSLRVVRELPMTYHTYSLKGQRILKRTYWFEMKTEHKAQLVPQIEEHIEKAQWVNPDFLDEYLGNTYASIHWLLESNKELLAK